ncbi:MAG: DCC1-like thiol-disulfide oxidoreductase family protein [Ferruginibacter sp.]
MKKNTKIIIYDDTCPMCAAYTNGFVHTGLLEKEGRKHFTEIAPELLALVDIKRCVNEIPVIDNSTSQVWYGIEAILEILNQKMPLIKKIGTMPTINWCLHKLYNFISYNRRVIVANQQPTTGFDCTPDFNVRYRIYFMAFFLVFNTWLLFPLHDYVFGNSVFSGSTIQQLQWGHLSIVVINIFLALKLGKKTGIEFLGQVNMLALITLLLSVPLILINKYLTITNSTINHIYLAGIAVVIVNEYLRRMKYAGILQLNPAIVLINVASIACLFFCLIY